MHMKSNNKKHLQILKIAVHIKVYIQTDKIKWHNSVKNS